MEVGYVPIKLETCEKDFCLASFSWTSYKTHEIMSRLQIAMHIKTIYMYAMYSCVSYYAKNVFLQSLMCHNLRNTNI